MKREHLIALIIVLLFAACPAMADRQLDRIEILDIFQKLTSQPRKTWIAAGTIEAIHNEYRAPKTTDPNTIAAQTSEEVRRYQDDSHKRELTDTLRKMRLDAIPFNVRYRLSNECSMRSAVSVRFDGERFYWEIRVDSRSDSIKAGSELADNFMTDQFDLGWNGRRIFAWDGEKYTTCSLPGNQAIVDSTGETPHVVTGPLTAGIIPWGYGNYSYEKLTTTNASGVEKSVDGQNQVHLTVLDTDGCEMLFVLDHSKDYAAISCLVTGPGNSKVSSQYSDYRLVSGIWVPTTILVERYEVVTNRLLSYDLWKLTNIIGEAPAEQGLKVEYEDDALIEFHSRLTNKPQVYRYSQSVNTDALLAERLAFAISERLRPQNCATAAMQYVISRTGKKVSDEQMARIVTEPGKTTSLYAMKQFAQAQGLCCRAVRTNIQTLKNLYGCEVILHIPGKNHFVVLAEIDNDYVWCIDLSSDKFYYRADVAFFNMDWTAGTALLVSNQPIQPQSELAEIDEDQLHEIVGGTGYSCTRLLQEYNVVFCTYLGPGNCEGIYQEYQERWGCEAAPSGSCSTSRMVRHRDTPCIVNPDDPFQCSDTGEWTYYYTRACL